MSNIDIMISRSKNRFLIAYVARELFFPQASNIKVLIPFKLPSFEFDLRIKFDFLGFILPGARETIFRRSEYKEAKHSAKST